MNWLKFCLHWLLGDYLLFRIYILGDAESQKSILPCRIGLICDQTELEKAKGIEIRRWAKANLEGSLVFAAWFENEIAGICIISPKNKGGNNAVWPFKAYEAELTQITTAQNFRNKGVASSLLIEASQEIRKRGIHQVFAKVWHSNAASRMAFAKAGWKYAGFLVEFHPFNRQRTLRFFFSKKELKRMSNYHE